MPQKTRLTNEDFALMQQPAHRERIAVKLEWLVGMRRETLPREPNAAIRVPGAGQSNAIDL